MNSQFKSLFTYLLPILVIVVVNVMYFFPQFEGKVVRQGDIIQHIGMSKEASDYRKSTGEEALWTNSMFGGMPTYQISAKPKNNLLVYVERAMTLFIDRPAGYFIAGMIGFYALLLLLEVNMWLGLLGALLFGFTTNNFILFEAGHNSKLMAIMTSAPVIAGVLLVFKEKYLLGATVFGVAFGINIAANHPQMTYYLGMCLALLVIIEFVSAAKKGRLVQFFKSIGVLLLVSLLSIGSSASKLWTTYEYTQSTMRGGQILKPIESTQPENGGLEWDYAMQWSNGTGDVLAGFIPKVVGGGSGEWLDGKSPLGKAIGQNQPFQFGTYFGSLPFTSGPAYFGIVSFLLFVFGLFAYRGKVKWWIFGAVLFTILLSMGKHFEVFNKLLFDYLPMFNKFRAPSSILSITAIFIPLLAVLGLSELIRSKDKTEFLKPLYYAAGSLIVICAGIYLVGPSFFSLTAASDGQYAQNPELYKILEKSLPQQRESMMTGSALRSLLFVLMVSGLIFGFIKEKLSAVILIAGVIVFGLLDLVQIDKGYLDKRDFVSKSTYKSEFEPRQVDIQILQDKDPNYRVLDATINTFNSASSSYFHKTIGGYSAVKMQRYQDLIDRQISKNNQAVFNMLNTKYFIVPGQDNNPTVQRNPAALGNVWFVNNVNLVKDNQAEIDSISNFDPAGTAVINSEFSDYLGTLKPQKNGSIVLKEYSPNKLVYQSETNGDQLAVFSEIWYGPDKGWQAYIDGKAVDHIRANYVLRAMKVPSGSHTITFEFKPKSYYLGETISLICSSILLLLLVFVIFKALRKDKSLSFA